VPVVKTTAKRLAVTPHDLARSLPRMPSGFPWSPPGWPGGVEREPVVSTLGVHYDTGWARSPAAKLGREVLTETVTTPVLRAVTSPRIEGLDRIAHLDEPVIFAANHTSHLDTPLLLSVLPEPWRHHTVVAAASDYFFDRRWKAATFALVLNAVPIERHKVNRASANRLGELLNEGWSLLIFPEGGRSPDGWGQDHRAGAAWLATRTGRVVVPVHVAGTGRILPKGATRPRRGKVTVTFGRPIRTGPDADARALAARLENDLAALGDEEATDWWSATKRAADSTTPPLTGPSAGAWRRSWALPKGHPRADPGSGAWPRD
jgi:1-acyl-sn-glycerol-3-phosphate acyltransferase